MSDLNKKQRFNTLVSLFFAVSLFFFIMTFSIGLPIYFRPFYYAHIDSMNLSEKSGFTEVEIREAYDEVLDYLTLPNKEFSAGVMAYSKGGAAHFADCKVLFALNSGVLLSSGICLIILTILRRTGKLNRFKLGRYPACIFSALAAVILPVILGTLAALDFNKAFVFFHSIFFPGKKNWLLNSKTDEIITVLPKDFFMHCAILIGMGIVIFSATILLIQWIKIKKKV